MPKGPFTSTTGTPTNNWTISGARDARTGLGYGILNPKTQLPRQMGAEFPYTEKEDSGEEDFDDESTDAVSNKYQPYTPSDFLRAAGSQPFYFVAGNTKLSDCFWKPGKVLNEIASFGDSMGPIPQMYNPNSKLGSPSRGTNASAGLSAGASFPYQGGGGSNYKRTGSAQGWSHSPPETWLQAEESAEKDESEEILTLKDLADKILRDQGESPNR